MVLPELDAAVIFSDDLVEVSMVVSGVEFVKQVGIVDLTREAVLALSWAERLELRKALAEALDVVDASKDAP